MKRHIFARMAMVLGLTAVMLLTPVVAAQASTESPEIARTKVWDGIESTLGGIPEYVRKIEYQDSIFYLSPNVSNEDFTAVIAAGPEAVRLKPTKAQNTDRLYQYPVYIIWNSDRTTLLVHPIYWDYDDVLEAVAIPTEPPANLTGIINGALRTAVSEPVDYRLTAEYADAVRMEFYRLLNEHRAENGLRELEVNLELQDYADIRADEQRTHFGHTRPDGSRAGSG